MEEPTNSGGLRDCDKESDDEKLELEHCDIGGVVTRKNSTVGFMSFLPSRKQKPGVGLALPPLSPSAGLPVVLLIPSLSLAPSIRCCAAALLSPFLLVGSSLLFRSAAYSPRFPISVGMFVTFRQ